MITCEECGSGVSDRAYSCPHCGNPMKPVAESSASARRVYRSFQWRTQAEILGWPLIHIAGGRDRQTGRLLVAKGIIAIGQFAIGLITIAQFGIGFAFAFGQFTAGYIAIGQVAIAIYFGLGQLATGATVIGQFAVGEYVLAQLGFGKHVWSTKIKDPEAVEYFKHLWETIRQLMG
jgi:hypothetical protein